MVNRRKFRISLETGVTSYSAGKSINIFPIFLFRCSFWTKNSQTQERNQDFQFAIPTPSQWTNIKISNHISTMCTLSEQTLGKCVPSMTQTIISKCSRTWSRERRNGVLHRSLEPRLSVWDCVPEHIIDAQVKDAVHEARFWLNASFANPHASLSTSPPNAITSSIMQFPVQQSCEAFADWMDIDHLHWYYGLFDSAARERWTPTISHKN